MSDTQGGLCGGCAGITGVTPADVENRAGLPAIAYRTGTHAGFLQTMLARLGADGPRGLATRESDDFSVALLDAWAAVGDVLTFYQERIANEHYWRTATERRSVVELARLLGYSLRPGVAASTSLAFAVESSPGSPDTVPVAAGIRVQSVPGPDEVPQTFETTEPITARPEWNLFRPNRLHKPPLTRGDQSVRVTNVALNIRPDDGLLFFSATKWAFRLVRDVRPDPATNSTVLHWDEPLEFRASPGHVTKPQGDHVFVFRQTTSLFGHNAPDWNAMSNDVQVRYNPPPPPPPPALTEWPGLTITGIGAGETPVPAYLDVSGIPIAAGSWLTITAPVSVNGQIVLKTSLFQIETVTATSRSRFAMSAKTTRVTLAGDGLLNDFNNAVRTAVVHVRSEPLIIADQVRTTPLDRRVFTLDRTLNPAPEPGRRLLICGTFEVITTVKAPGTDQVKSVLTLEPRGEVATVESATGSPTVLRLAADLRHDYLPATVSIFGNVAEATHGESVTEILGSGDARRGFQSFELKQAPVTFRAGGPGGATHTLEVWVGGVRWREVPTLYGTGPRDRVYVTRRDDANRTTVQFGDGRTGSRLPSGVENVRAVYRKGIGRGGLVRADQLTLLLSRPLGLKSVTNPLPASGAADPETLASARRTGPFTALTLGRVVSLTDYRDFAAGFAGIAKADATWVWDRHTRGVAVTVAGVNGDSVPPDGRTGKQLLAAMNAARDRLYPLKLMDYQPVKFRLAANVRVSLDRVAADVVKAVRAALAVRFAFDDREFGQSVTLGDVVATAQRVPGVVAVTVPVLHRQNSDPAPNAVLTAARPKPGTDFDTVTGAELLVLDETCLTDVRAAP